METIEYKACNDCAPIIANGDASHLDYFYFEADAAEKLAKIEAGIDALQKRDNVRLSMGDADHYEGFSSAPCEVCGCKLAGERLQLLGLKLGN